MPSPSDFSSPAVTRDFSDPRSKREHDSSGDDDFELPSWASNGYALATRQLTPRGPIYPTLTEAHTNITARIHSRSASQHATGEENVDYSDSIPLQELNSLLQLVNDDIMSSSSRQDLPAQRPSIIGRSLTDYQHLKHRAAPNSPSSPTPGADQFDSSELAIDERFPPQQYSSEPVLPPHPVSGSTVERIVDQYVPSGPSSQIEPQLKNRGGLNPTFRFPVESTKNRPATPFALPHPDTFADPSKDGDYFLGPHDEAMEPKVALPQPSLFEKAVDISGEPAQDAQKALTSATAPYGEVNDARKEKHRWAEQSAPSTAPQISLPPVPRLYPSNPFSTSTEAPVPESSKSIMPPMIPASDTKLLLEGDNKEKPKVIIHSDSKSEGGSRLSCLLPPPDRMHSTRNRGRRVSAISVTGVSTGGVSTGNMTQDSDDDPFRYDKHPVFVKPSKEREVSAALHLVSGFGRESQATLCSADGKPLQIPFGDISMSPASVKKQSPLRTMTSQGGTEYVHTEHGAFYDSSAIKPGWSMGSPDVVKVPVSRRLRAAREDEAASKDGGVQGQNADGKLVVLDRLRREDGDRGRTGDSEDWQTECTSGAALGGVGLSFNQNLSGPNYIKRTGDSIANISDFNYGFESDAASSYRDGLYDSMGNPYGSSQVGLVHPLAQGISSEDTRYVKRDIKDAPFPVFLPEQRQHKVNGVFQDSSRGLPQSSNNAAQASSSVVSNIVRKVSSPFRRQSTKRPQAKNFPSSLTDRRSRYHFADSDSDGEFQGKRRSIRQQGNRPTTRDKKLAIRAALTIEAPPPAVCTPGPKTAPPESYVETLRTRVNTHEYPSEAEDSFEHSFQFTLVPLSEAARMQAIRRASAQEDNTPTVTGRAPRFRLPNFRTFTSQRANPATPQSSQKLLTVPAEQRSRFYPRQIASSPLAGREDQVTANSKTSSLLLSSSET